MSDIQQSQPKCLLVTSHYLPMYGGALTVYDALASEAGGAIEILTASQDYITGKEVEHWRDFDAEAPYKIHRLPALRGELVDKEDVPTLSPLNFFKNKARDEKVLKDVLSYIKSTNANILCIGALETLGWLASSVKKHVDIKVVLYVHGEEVSQKAYSWLAERRRQRSLKHADAIVAVSHFTANLVHSKYGVAADKVHCLKNGVDLARFNQRSSLKTRQELGLPEGSFVFSFGRLVERKGFDILLDAWPRVLKERPNAQLVIGGEGPLEDSLQQKITSSHLSESVTMLGWVDNSDLPSVYAHSDLFVMPNRTLDDGDTEGFGLVLLEAAAMGVPVIAGDAGGAPDALLSDETGLLVDGTDPKSIADEITRILKNDGQRIKMGEAAAQYAQTQGWAGKAEALFHIFDKLTASP